MWRCTCMYYRWLCDAVWHRTCMYYGWLCDAVCHCTCMYYNCMYYYISILQTDATCHCTRMLWHCGCILSDAMCHCTCIYKHCHNGLNHTRWCRIRLKATWSLFQHPIKRLIARSRKVSKPWDLCLKLYDRFEIWQAPPQQWCRCACQISKRCDNLNYQPGDFETSPDLPIRRHIGLKQGPGYLMQSAIGNSVLQWSQTYKF